MTGDCLQSLYDYTNNDTVEVLVIDDGSPLGTDVEDVIHREENGGYCAAINTGFRHCIEDIIVVGNNDLLFSEGWLEALLHPLEQGYDISTVWTSDQHNIKLEQAIEMDAKFGSLFAMKRTVYETLGGFDEQFRDYFGDLDYRRRAMDAGFSIGKNLNYVVEHKAKATYKEVDPYDDRYQRGLLLYEAKWGYLE